MDFAVVAPWVGLVAALGLGMWQARARSSSDIGVEAGDFLLRQNEALGRQLRDAQRDCRKAERAYYELLSWAVRVQQTVAQQAPGVALPPMPQRATNGESQDLPPLTDRDEVRLRKLLVERMQVDDLRTLAYDLGCEDVRGETAGEMARSLLDYVRTRRKWTEMLKWLADNRPDIKE